MTKESFDTAMIPLRIRAAKAKADGEVIRIEEQLLKLETRINEQCAHKELNFYTIIDLLDEYALAERKLEQINKLIADLFPAE